jgi:hypothetical protein
MPFSELDLVPVNYSSAMASSVYLNDYRKERLQLWVDNLNLLYVAFTRARSNLVVWCKSGKKGTMSELLANALPGVSRNLDCEWMENEVFEYGEVVPSCDRGKVETTNKLTQCPQKCSIGMVSLKHDIEFRQSNRSADFINGVEANESDRRFIDRGRLMHTLFSAIATKDDIDTAISRLVFEGIINGDEEKVITELAHKAFCMPEVQDWYSGRWRLFNEHTILYKENGTLQTKRPDRVMVDGDKAVVVDFKFGRRSDKYISQVQSYMSLLREMGYGFVEGYLWYVDKELVERVPDRII